MYIEQSSKQTADLLDSLLDSSKEEHSQEQVDAINKATDAIDEACESDEILSLVVVIPKESETVEEFHDIIRRIKIPFCEFIKGYATKSFAAMSINSRSDVIISIMDNGDNVTVSIKRIELFAFSNGRFSVYDNFSVKKKEDKIIIPLVFLEELSFIVNTDNLSKFLFEKGYNFVTENIMINTQDYHDLFERYSMFQEA